MQYRLHFLVSGSIAHKVPRSLHRAGNGMEWYCIVWYGMVWYGIKILEYFNVRQYYSISLQIHKCVLIPWSQFISCVCCSIFRSCQNCSVPIVGLNKRNNTKNTGTVRHRKHTKKIIGNCTGC